MNIFMTSMCPRKSAEALPRVLCTKMILESAQLLCTAHRVIDGDAEGDRHGLYKKTHMNHPCSIFVRDSIESYFWTYLNFKFLCERFENYAGKKHKTSLWLDFLSNAPKKLSTTKKFEPVAVVPQEMKENTIEVAYRQYLNYKFLEWQSREKPVKIEYPDVEPPHWLSPNIKIL